MHNSVSIYSNCSSIGSDPCPICEMEALTRSDSGSTTRDLTRTLRLGGCPHETIPPAIHYFDD